MAKATKRQTTLSKVREDNRTPLSAEDAIKLLKSKDHAVKFDETVEIHFRLGVNPKQNDQQIRSDRQSSWWYR